MVLTKRKSFLLLIFVLVISISAGLFARFSKLDYIYQNKNFYFYDKDKPVLATADGYIYLRYAKDFEKGIFSPKEVDPFRHAPENFINLPDKDKAKYPDLLPLNSFLIFVFHKITNWSIDKTASYLAPILAVFVVIPIALLFFRMNLYTTALSGSLLSVISYMYVSRTSFARPDTDSLNLFFPFLIAYLSYLFIDNNDKKKLYIISILLAITNFLYYWWYFHADLIVLMFIAFLIALSINKGIKSFKEYKFHLVIIFILSGMPLYLLFAFQSFVSRIANYILGKNLNVSVDIIHPYSFISENQHFSLISLANFSVGNEIMFVIGLIGAFIFFFKYWRVSILLLPIFLIGLLSLKLGNRFIIYLSPFIGIGFGYILDLLLKYLKEENRPKILSLNFILVPIILIFLNINVFNAVYQPILNSKVAEGFYKLKNKLPSNSWIWSWWDIGYPVQYISEKTTYVDNGDIYPPKVYYIALSYLTPNLEETYNIIKVLSYLGTDNLVKLNIEKGMPISEVSKQVRTEKKRDIFILFSSDQIAKFGWIGYLGSWDFKKKTGKKQDIYTLKSCMFHKNYIECGKGYIKVDLTEGYIFNKFTQKKKLLSKFVYVSEKNKIVKNFNNANTDLVLEVIYRKENILFLLMKEDTFKSAFNNMYLLNEYNQTLFEKVYDNFPYVVVFRLKQ